MKKTICSFCKTRAELVPAMAIQSVFFSLFQPIPAIWSYLELFAFLEIFGTIETYSELYRAIWSHLEPFFLLFGAICSHLDLFLDTESQLELI